MEGHSGVPEATLRFAEEISFQEPLPTSTRPEDPETSAAQNGKGSVDHRGQWVLLVAREAIRSLATSYKDPISFVRVLLGTGSVQQIPRGVSFLCDW